VDDGDDQIRHRLGAWVQWRFNLRRRRCGGRLINAGSKRQSLFTSAFCAEAAARERVCNSLMHRASTVAVGF
jgi:hypothetical protein